MSNYVFLLLLVFAAPRPSVARSLFQEDDVAVPSPGFALTQETQDEVSAFSPSLESSAYQEDLPSTLHYPPASDVITSPEIKDILEPFSVPCGSERQLVMCGDIPFTDLQARRECCEQNVEVTPSPEVAALLEAADAAQEVVAASTAANRPDLSSTGASAKPPPYIYNSTCLQSRIASIPSFLGTNNGRPLNFTVPFLTATAIARIKSAAISALQAAPATAWLANAINKLRRVNGTSGFIHPGSYAGAQELSLLSFKLSINNPAIAIARDSLITGSGVPPKRYGSWAPFTSTPLSNYTGPYAMPNVQIKWSGWNAAGVTCAPNYPSGALLAQCGHISFVELDAVQAVRQALAYWSTNNTGFAANAQRIVNGWATKNTQWGLRNENGPLEAGWGCAAMAKSLELLKHKPWSGYDPSVEARFMSWFRTVLFPQMNWLVTSTVNRVRNGEQNVYSNW
jgi:hypothetical protein